MTPVEAARGADIYLSLLHVPQVPRLLGGSLLGRSQLGMASLAILLVAHDETGSFADAGAAVGLFGGIGAAATPVLGRLVDRLGAVVVLAVAGAVQSLAFVVLALGARHGASFEALLAVTAIAGISLPPLSSTMRALWPVLVPEPHLREAAYTLDAIAQELIWTLGPLLVAVFVALWSASSALLVCAAFTAAGVATFVASPVTRGWRAEHVHHSWLGPLNDGRSRRLLLCIGIASVGTGICQVAIPAIGVRAGSSASAGVLLGVWSIGSMLCAIAVGAVQWRVPVEARYRLLFVAMAVLTLPLAAARSVPAGVLCAFLAGLPLAALISCQYTLVSRAAPRGTVTESFAWNSAAAFGALATGSAIGGSVVKQYGLGWAFGAAALAAVAAATAASTPSLRESR